MWQIFANSEYGIGRFEVSAPAVLPPLQRFRLTFRLLQWRWQLVAVIAEILASARPGLNPHSSALAISSRKTTRISAVANVLTHCSRVAPRAGVLADEQNIAFGALHLPQHGGIIVADPPVDAGMICLTKSGS